MSQSVRVKLFAVVKQVAGADAVELELPDAATVADLRRALLSKLPALDGLSNLLLFAVNGEYAGDQTKLPPAAEVACIPPVSGG